MPYDPDQLTTDVDYLTTLPQWQDEATRPQFIREAALKAGPNLDPQGHAEFANALWERSKGGLLKRGADFVARGAEEMVKSFPAAGGAGAFAAGDALGITDTGSGTRLKRGAADLLDATGQRAKQLASGELLGMNLLPGESQQAKRDSTLEALKQSLDQGLYPQGLEQWMTGEFDGTTAKPDEETQQWIGLLTSGLAERAVAADHMGKVDPLKVRAWMESDRSPARADSDIPGEIGPRELLADYVATRDPSSWEAFQARVSETDSQRTTRLQRYAAEGEVRAVNAVRPDGLGKDLATRGMDMQTSPIDLATVAMPIFRGRAALNAARAGGAVKQVLKGMGAEALQEGTTEYLSDPNAGTGRVLEAAGLGAVGQGVVSAPMAAAGALMRPSTSNDSLSPNQTPAQAGTPQAPGTTPATAPLDGQAGLAGLEEDTGELTAAEVADLERAAAPAFTDSGVEQTMSDPQADVLRDFGIRPAVQPRQDSLMEAPEQAGDVITDLRIPRSPAAIAESQRVENERLAQQAGLRNQQAKAGRGPVIPDSPLGVYDILDFVNENRIRLPKAGETNEGGQNDWAEQFSVPQYYRQFLGNTERGGSIDQVAQMAFENGFIQEPTPDALMGAVQQGIATRKQYRVELVKQQRQQMKQADRAMDFEKTQGTLRSKDQERVAFDQLATGDQLKIDGENVQVQQVQYDDDGYLTNVVLEDGKRFGVMQFDPQTRGGIFVDAFTPNPSSGFKNLDTSGTTAGFLNTDIINEAVDLIRQGITDFANWSRAMLTRFGRGIAEYLRGVWQAAMRTSQVGAVGDVRGGAPGAASNVRMGRAESPNETQSRFASPAAADRVINGPRTDELVAAEANAWLNSLDQETAIESFARQQVPLPLDAAERAAAVLIDRLSGQATTGKTEVLRMWAHVQGQRMARIWTKEFLSADPARALRQRGVVNNTILAPIAPIMAAQELLTDRATKVIDARFDGGAEGAVEKVKEVVKKADAQAGETLAGQLDDATSSGTDPRIADLEARLKELRTQMTAGDAAMQQTTSTWQKIMNLLNAASKRKSSMLNGARSKLSALREAAQQRKAQRRAEGRLNANPVEDFADDAIIGAALLAEGIVEFANWSQAMIREVGARSSTELKELYAAASQQYHDALAEQAKRPSAMISRDSPALARLLDKLRRKLYPGMRWADIFSELPDSQKARQLEIYKRLLEDEKLKDLTAEERLQLTNELDKAWLRERRKVFMRELEKAGVLGEKPRSIAGLAADRLRGHANDLDKVKAAAPRLLRLMNLGMLDSAMFREALAKEYGLKMIDAKAAAELRTLGERIQTAPEGLPRRKLEVQFMERLQTLAGTTFWQVMDSWWTASVLSGWRTQVDIGLSIANGIEDVGLGSLVTAMRTGNKDVALRGLGSLFGRIPSAFMEAVDHLRTGNKALMRNFELEAKQALEGGNRMASDVGAQMWRDGGWRKVPGGFMIFYGRLMTALDHVNSASTREGAKAMALARHPELYQKALRISDADRQAARQQARLELTGGALPTTQQERLEETARVREILDQGIPAEVIAEATEVGRAAALQGEPTGLGGWLLNAVLAAVNTVNQKSQELAKRENPDRVSRGGAVVTAAMVPLVRAITGTKFARTVAHALNRTTSYVPGVGIITVGQQGRTGAFGDILAARQVIGTLVGIALYLAFDDDDDERGIEDSWKDKTPQQKAQLYAQGKQPFTVWERDAKGRVRSYNYQQWGIAGIVNTVAAMLKQKGSEQGTLNVLMSSLVQGGLSFTDKAQLQGLQTVIGENSRSTDPVSGIAAGLNKYAAQTIGGLVPRLIKDIDMVASPELRTSADWWQKWAKEVPMLRQLTSGKRIDILGGDILLDRGPLSRVTMLGTADPVYRILGRLNEKDVWLPDPSQGVRIVKLQDGTRRNMTPAEKDRYQRLTGAAYRDYLQEHGPRLLQMDPEDAKTEISRVTKAKRDRAAYQATHR